MPVLSKSSKNGSPTFWKSIKQNRFEERSCVFDFVRYPGVSKDKQYWIWGSGTRPKIPKSWRGGGWRFSHKQIERSPNWNGIILRRFWAYLFHKIIKRLFVMAQTPTHVGFHLRFSGFPIGNPFLLAYTHEEIQAHEQELGVWRTSEHRCAITSPIDTQSSPFSM